MLQQIQAELKAPKGQTNTFGKYKYRSCEDILEAVKPILAKHNISLTLSDDMIEVGGRVYVQATAVLKKDGAIIESVTACAREAVDKKGMDDAQITGAASSYARKYALNGLFCIDDTKDADATNDHGKGTGETEYVHKHEDSGPEQKKTFDAVLASLRNAGTMEEIDRVARKAESIWNKWPSAWISAINAEVTKREKSLK